MHVVLISGLLYLRIHLNALGFFFFLGEQIELIRHISPGPTL